MPQGMTAITMVKSNSHHLSGIRGSSEFAPAVPTCRDSYLASPERDVFRDSHQNSHRPFGASDPTGCPVQSGSKLTRPVLSYEGKLVGKREKKATDFGPHLVK